MLVSRDQIQKRYAIPDSLTHNAGTITAIFNNTSYSTVLTGLVANTLYFLYLRTSGGVTELFYSGTLPSVYRITFPEAILVGAFYSNGLISIGFGSFVDIESQPRSFTNSLWLPTGSWTTNTTYEGTIRREGKNAIISANVNLSGAPNATQLSVNLPTNLVVLLSDYINSSLYSGDATVQGHQAGTGYNLQITNVTTNSCSVGYQGSVAASQTVVSSTLPINWNGGQITIRNLKVPITGWTETPLKDL